MNDPEHIGRTKSAGYQAGVRRTVAVPPEKAWNVLISKEGLELWLGTSGLDKWETGLEFSTGTGIVGSVRVFKVFSHIRINWKMKDWKQTSILQVRTIPARTGTTISFHHEHLQDARQREQMKKHWSAVLEKLMILIAE